MARKSETKAPQVPIQHRSQGWLYWNRTPVSIAKTRNATAARIANAKLKGNPIGSVVPFSQLAVQLALKSGFLVKPKKCGNCGAEKERIEGHHDDYAKPLEVRWLCPKCHKAWHRKIRQQIPISGWVRRRSVNQNRDNSNNIPAGDVYRGIATMMPHGSGYPARR